MSSVEGCDVAEQQHTHLICRGCVTLLK